MAQITMDSDSMSSIAKSLANISSSLRSVSGEVNSAITTLQLDNVFTGSFSPAMLSGGRSTASSMKAKSDILSQLSSAATSTDNAFRQADHNHTLASTKYSSLFGAIPAVGAILGGGNTCVAGEVTTLSDAFRKDVKRIKSYWGKLCDKAVGTTKAVISKTAKFVSTHKTQIVDAAKSLWKYGKGAIKIAGAVSTLLAAVGLTATGVGAPIGAGAIAMALFSLGTGCNDVANATADMIYSVTGQHDKVGTTNFLKSYLSDCGNTIGTYFGNPEMGELIGKATYLGIDTVSMLSSADKMLKALGDVDVLVTGTSRYSPVWGWTHFDNYIDHTTPWILHTAAKGVTGTIKSAITVGNDFAGILFH